MLTDADLTDAMLRDATLLNAAFDFTDLSGANLTGADLEHAFFYRAILGGTVLLGARNLETCQHYGPSVIDLPTIRLAGSLPLAFLRGVGLPDDVIEYLPSLTGRAIEFYSCFISYSHADKSFARRLHDQLQGNGIRCWRDEKAMKIGEKILPAILGAIRMHDRVVLLCSKSSLTTPWVQTELEEAFEREENEDRPILLPLDLDGYLFHGWKGPLAIRVRERLAADFTGWEADNAKFEAQFERLVKALRAGEDARPKPPPSKL